MYVYQIDPTMIKSNIKIPNTLCSLAMSMLTNMYTYLYM